MHCLYSTVAGIAGIGCFAISIRFAFASLMYKLSARKQTSAKQPNVAYCELRHVHPPRENDFSEPLSMGPLTHIASAPNLKSLDDSDSAASSDHDENEGRVDKVYTVGCFDLFHRGHINLLKNMRKLGREVGLCTCSCMLHTTFSVLPLV